MADPVRHGGSKTKARHAYEQMIYESFRNAAHALKSDAQMVVVYAHKTTLGWATLVDGLRRAGLQVTEAWPIDTEMTGGMRVETASLSSRIFLAAQKRDGAAGGNYEEQVRPELEQIVPHRETPDPDRNDRLLPEALPRRSGPAHACRCRDRPADCRVRAPASRRAVAGARLGGAGAALERSGEKRGGSCPCSRWRGRRAVLLRAVKEEIMGLGQQQQDLAEHRRRSGWTSPSTNCR